MGEAIIPGAKVGNTFKKGTKKIFNIAEELREALTTSSEDVVVILDKHFKLSSKGTSNDSKDKSNSLGFDEQSRRAAEVIRAAGCICPLLESVVTNTIVEKAP